MSFVRVFIWQEEYVEDGWIAMAIDAIDNEMAPQFDFDIITKDRSWVDEFPNNVGGTSDAAFADEFGSWVMDTEYDSPTEPTPRDIHLLIVENAHLSAGHIVEVINDKIFT